VFLLFHSRSPVKVAKLLELVKKHKSRYRLAPDGRLAFTPKGQDWEALVREVLELLDAVHEAESELPLPLEPLQG
jgi:transcription-repair coupling factor (superfamily II helicase)